MDSAHDINKNNDNKTNQQTNDWDGESSRQFESATIVLAIAVSFCDDCACSMNNNDDNESLRTNE